MVLVEKKATGGHSLTSCELRGIPCLASLLVDAQAVVV
jgi:hypothetical protein